MSYVLKERLANPGNYGGSRAVNQIKYLVFHYTGNDGDQAANNAAYFQNNIVQASAHYFVDDTTVWRSVPDLKVAWAVGGKKYANADKTGGGTMYGMITNTNSISIEMCDTIRNGIYQASEATLANAAALGRELMEKYGMSAIVSPVGQFSDEYAANGDRSVYYAMATWDDLKTLAASAYFELQNHSYHLHAQSPRHGAERCAGESDEAYQSMLTNDLGAMQDAMETRCGVRPQAFVYPFGGVDSASDPVLRALGFRASLSCNEHVNTVSRDPECLWLLGRYNRPYGISTEEFMAKLSID